MKGIPTRPIAAGFLLLSLVGFVDATYLTIYHLRGGGLECGPIWDCDEAAASEYSEILNVPIALVGAVYYLTILLLTVGYLDTGKNRFLRIIAPLTGLGLLASLVLVGLQVFVIRSLCLYCMISALCSIGLAAVAATYYIAPGYRE